MIRPMTQEERERATERRLSNMTTAKSICEIRLHNAMVRNELTLEECINAIDSFAEDKKFHEQLDKVYKNGIEDDWDTWHDGNIT
jgi:hypothetical protein